MQLFFILFIFLLNLLFHLHLYSICKLWLLFPWSSWNLLSISIISILFILHLLSIISALLLLHLWLICCLSLSTLRQRIQFTRALLINSRTQTMDVKLWLYKFVYLSSFCMAFFLCVCVCVSIPDHHSLYTVYIIFHPWNEILIYL